MSHQQHPKQQNRPSLYEPRQTNTVFSILGAAQPLGWSKKKSIGLSIISFIAGGVLSGGAVGLMKLTDQTSAPIPELAKSAIPKTIPEPTPKPTPTLPVSHQPSDRKDDRIDDAKDDRKESNLVKPLSSLPMKNPLASFKEDDIQKTIQSKINSQKVEEHRTSLTKDDAQLQRLIESKTQHDVLAPTHITNRVGNQPIPHTVAPQKKPLSHDKDVLLVKSMLDTMDHPLAVNITTRAKSSDDSK